MKFDLSKVEISRNDLKKGLKLPEEMSLDLAELIGIHMGDGYMDKVVRPARIDYQIYYSGHLIDDYDYHTKHIAGLYLKLFNRKVIHRECICNCIQTYFRSKGILNFLHNICELPLGKKQNLKIPKVVTDAGEEYVKAFIRGFADTDFSLCFKRRHKKIKYYPTINCGLADKRLVKDIKKWLDLFGFRVCYHERKNPRHGKYFDSYQIALYGKSQLYKWIDEIGFSNSKCISKFNEWEEKGFVE